MGTLDEGVLRGEWGLKLAVAEDGHFWVENRVEGVTDRVGVGELFVKESKSEVWKG